MALPEVAELLQYSGNGTEVAIASGTDQDSGQVLRYALLDSADGRFEIDPGTGRLQVREDIEQGLENFTLRECARRAGVGQSILRTLIILPFAMTTALYALEFLVAALQAYVFAMLTTLYFNDALHPGH